MLAVLAAALLVGLLWVWGQPSGMAKSSPGPLYQAGQVLSPSQGQVPSRPPGGGQVLFPTVSVTEMAVPHALWCALVSDCDYVELSSQADSAAQEMVESALIARAAARAVQPGLDIPAPAVGAGGIGGPSAGLAFALHLLDQGSDGDLFAGGDVVATGAVTTDGKVSAVGGVKHKLHAAAQIEPVVFFAPIGSLRALGDQAPKVAVEVVEVESVSEAVQWLCRNGATGTLCAR